jgi:putative transposase
MHTYRIENQQAMHFLTMTSVGWIDLFTRKNYRDVLIESLKFCQANKGLVIHAFVIMSNHLHVIVSVTSPFRLSDVLRDFKKFTAHEFIRMIDQENESRKDWLQLVMKYHANFNKNNRDNQFWQQENHAIELYSPDFTYQKLNYIHQNPVRAGWVTEPAHYIYSSASNYFEQKGILEISPIEIMPTIGYIHFGKQAILKKT